MSRRVKRDDLTLGECREYWDSRRTDDERAEVAEAIRRARLGLNPRQENRLEAAVSFSMRHHFEKEAALPVEELVITALEHGMGSARLDDVEQELKRQGVIIVEKDGQRLATTKALQDEEWGLAAYAMDGRGQVMPIGVADGLARKALSARIALRLTVGRGAGAAAQRQPGRAVAWPRRRRQVEAAANLRRRGEAGRPDGHLSRHHLHSVKVLKKDGFKDTQTLAPVPRR